MQSIRASLKNIFRQSLGWGKLRNTLEMELLSAITLMNACRDHEINYDGPHFFYK